MTVADTKTIANDTKTIVTHTKTVVTETKTVVTDTKTVVTDTQTMVADTQTMVADIHRNLLTEREGASSTNHSVGSTLCPSTMEYLPSLRIEPG
jgi:hypothetical protein